MSAGERRFRLPKTRKYEPCSIYACIHSRIQAAYSLYAVVSVGLQTSPICWDKSRIPDQARSQSYFLLDHWLIRSQPLHVSLLYTSTRLIHVPYTRLSLHGKISRPILKRLPTFFYLPSLLLPRYPSSIVHICIALFCYRYVRFLTHNVATTCMFYALM